MPRLPILMYHSVSQKAQESKALTISTKKLEQQLKYLNDEGYVSLHFSELERINAISEFPKKAIIITFDDVYVNQLEFAVPLLQKYGVKASFFIPFAYVDGVDSWNTGTEKIMSVDQLKSLDSNVIELGIHSFQHNKYNELSAEAIEQDFNDCKNFIIKNKLSVHNILAYPYGKYPRKEPMKSDFFKVLNAHNIAYALRIGNRVNRFPFKNNFEIKRIDIKGEDSFKTFKLKLRFGKLKLF